MTGAAACSGRVVIAPGDALQRRAYIAPVGLTFSVEGGQLSELTFEPAHPTPADPTAVAWAVTLSLRRHEAAPSAEVTVFVLRERVFPPTALGGLRVACPDAIPGDESCARDGLRDSYIIRLRGAEVTRVRFEPATGIA